jgi:hypothetical protein
MKITCKIYVKRHNHDTEFHAVFKINEHVKIFS